MVKEILVDTEALPFRSLSKREPSPWRSLPWHPVAEDGFQITLCCHTPPHSPGQCNDKQGDAVRTPLLLLSVGETVLLSSRPTGWRRLSQNRSSYKVLLPSILTFTDLTVKSWSDGSLPTSTSSPFHLPCELLPKIFFSSNFFHVPSHCY